MVVHTGGFSPQDSSSPAMRFLATGDSVLGIPNALLVWAAVGGMAVFLLTRTTFGRAVYAIGNRERAAYLSGARTRAVVMQRLQSRAASRPLAACSSPAMRARRPRRWATHTCCRRSPRWSLGGTSILGGRGNYLGTVAGVILITLLAVDAVGDADGGVGPARDLRRGDHCDAVDLRPRPAPLGVATPVFIRSEHDTMHLEPTSSFQVIDPALSKADVPIRSRREALQPAAAGRGTGVVRGRALPRLVRHSERSHAALG